VNLAEQFFRAFGSAPPALNRLKELRRDVERPPESDEDPESYERETSAAVEREYWTVDRIFEDL
jgi:hypothetical protein